tara:strand:+ start:514 stop:837 length:324 start_codon:yes stop_codon:yes gene_type:complete
MAIENNDLFVLQKSGGGELRKASVAALLAKVVTPVVPEELSDLSDVSDTVPTDTQVLQWNGSEWEPTDVEGSDLTNYLQKPGTDGSFVVVETSGVISYSDTVDGGTY